MKQKLRKVAEAFAWFGIILQYGVAVAFFYLTVTVPPSEITLALAGLTLALLSTATANLYNLRQSKKVDEILKKLEEIRKQTEHSPVGETLVTIVDYLIKRKTGGKK